MLNKDCLLADYAKTSMIIFLLKLFCPNILWAVNESWNNDNEIIFVTIKRTKTQIVSRLLTSRNRYGWLFFKNSIIYIPCWPDFSNALPSTLKLSQHTAWKSSFFSNYLSFLCVRKNTKINFRFWNFDMLMWLHVKDSMQIHWQLGEISFFIRRKKHHGQICIKLFQRTW